MQYIWLFLVVVSICFLLFCAPDLVLTAMTTATQNAVTLSISLLGVYILWLGVLNVVKNCGLMQKVAKFIQKPIKKLFGNTNKEVCDNIAANLSANLLGVGNASTPPAMLAIKQMDKGDGKITKGMAMLFVINACGLQLIPTTIIGIRSSMGSNNPTDIILPCLLTSIATTAVGILLVCLVYGDKK